MSEMKNVLCIKAFANVQMLFYTCQDMYGKILAFFFAETNKNSKLHQRNRK